MNISGHFNYVHQGPFNEMFKAKLYMYFKDAFIVISDYTFYIKME